jgi:hypothetical protein
MKARTLLLAGGVLIVAITVVLYLRESRQELARTPNPDGTWTVIIGRERLLGLLGIEIIYAREDAAGHVSGGSVKGQCWSWREARQRYASKNHTDRCEPLPD